MRTNISLYHKERFFTSHNDVLKRENGTLCSIFRLFLTWGLTARVARQPEARSKLWTCTAEILPAKIQPASFFHLIFEGGGGGGGGTWVNFCWVCYVCAAGLLEPLPFNGVFCGRLQTPSQSRLGKCKFCDPNLVIFCLCIYLINPLNQVILKRNAMRTKKIPTVARIFSPRKSRICATPFQRLY